MSRKPRAARPIREAVGVFVDAGKLHEAAHEILSSGFGPTEIGLLASELTIEEALCDYYKRAPETTDKPKAPNTAFVAKDSVGDTIHAYIGALSFAGTTVAGGAVVASAGVLGGGLLAAVAGVAAVAAMGTVLGLIVRQSDAERMEEQIDEGHLLLFVQVRDAEHEALAKAILGRHTPIEVLVIDAPARNVA